MNRAFETLSAALLTSTVCLLSIACESPEQDRPATPVASAEVEVEVAPVPEAAPAPAPAPAPIEVESPIVDEQPVLANTTLTPVAPKLERNHKPTSLRSPTLLPTDTPEANVAAFTNLRQSQRDKAPIAGAGLTGIHLDELELGSGWASSRCEAPSRSFVVEQDERVNLCFRVVHPREAEAVTVEWARDGKLRQAIQVNVPDTHAYLTRAWMPVSAGRAGQWTATVKSSDGVVLGSVAFEISK